MNAPSIGTYYSRAARFFHWTMALIVMSAWGLGFYSAYVSGEDDRHAVISLHKMIGSTVILLVVLRLLYRWLAARHYPPLPADTSSGMKALAHTVHAMLYLVPMIAAPLTGWYYSSVYGKPVVMLGLIRLPPLARADPALVDIAGWAHVTTVWMTGGLIAVHLLAVLKHVVVDRDDTLRRMLGRRLPRVDAVPDRASAVPTGPVTVPATGSVSDGRAEAGLFDA